jgi:hypothetical protein
MSAETECDSELGIAHVLFIDTVGYSKWLLNEQRRVLETLKKIVRATRSFQDAKIDGRLRFKPCNLSDAAQASGHPSLDSLNSQSSYSIILFCARGWNA